MVTSGCPSKVTACRAATCTADAPAEGATVAAPICSGALPKKFDTRNRVSSPAVATVTTLRTVASFTTPLPQAMAEPQVTRHTGAGSTVVAGGRCETAVVGGLLGGGAGAEPEMPGRPVCTR